MNESEQMTSQAAVDYVFTDLWGYKNYSELGREIGAQPIQVKNYLSGKHTMSATVAKRFYEAFGIEIADVITGGRPSMKWG